MEEKVYEVLIVSYAFSALWTGPFSLHLFELHYLGLARKHHGRQLYLRKGCSIIALIVVNLLSPITLGIVLTASLLTVFCGLIDKIRRCRQSTDEPISRSSNIANIQHRAKRPSYIIEEVAITIKQDQSTFPCIDTVSQIKDDDNTCPICLRRINSLNTNRMNKTEIKLKRALDDELCVTLCNHVMHFKCLKNWLDLHQTCPICGSKQLVKQCKV